MTDETKPSFKQMRGAFFAEFAAEAELNELRADARISSDDAEAEIASLLRQRRLVRSAMWDKLVAASPRPAPAPETKLPEWATDVSPEVVELCKAAEQFLGAQRSNAVGMGAGSGTMNAAEDRAARELESANERIPRRFKTEAFARLHDALQHATLRMERKHENMG